MSDNPDSPKVWPPRAEHPTAPRSAPDGPKAGTDNASAARPAAVVGIVVLVVVAFLLVTGGDDDAPTTAPSTAGSTTSEVSPATTPAPSGEPVAPGSVSPKPPSGDEGDQRANSAQACGRFRAVADALPSGDELRAKLQEVNVAAAGATPAVRDSARAMLDAVMEEDGRRFLRAGSQLATACRAAGH